MRARSCLAASMVVAFACATGSTDPNTAGLAVPSAEQTRAEFLALAEQLRARDNPYFGLQPLNALRDELSEGTLDPAKRFLALTRLAELETKQALAEESVAHADEAVGMIARRALNAPPGSELRKALAAAHMVRAVAYLRLAEQRNCVAHHNPQSCLFPIEGGGVHTDREAATAALASLAAVLEHAPGDLSARWLANIAAMTLGRASDIDARLHDAGWDGPPFTDAAPLLGIAGLELAGGVVAEDFDGDGLIDIVTSTSDPAGPMRFYRNDGDGGFSDRTRESRLDAQLGGLNVIGADYDNDGDPDLLVLRGAWHLQDGRMRNSLLRNDGAVFTDVTRAAGVDPDPRPTQAACWADFDGDGDLDLYVGNESDPSLGLDFPSQLYRNDGDGTFTEIGAEAGVTNDRYAKGVTAGDYDDDGDMDLYVSNVGDNRLYRNDGGLRFTDVAPGLGLVDPRPRSFAPWFFDVDNDGDLDLFVGAYEGLLEDVARDYLGEPYAGPPPALYRNEGDGTFTDIAREAGLDRPWMPMGANFGDLDNDGRLDLYLGTGNPNLKTLVPNVALRNVDGTRFEDVTVSAGLGHLQKGHGVAFADFDQDGDQDLYHQLGGFYPSDAFGNALFLNPGGRGAQVELELRGVDSNRFGVGARVTLVLETPNGRREVHRAVGSVSSFGGSPVGRSAIGVGDATRVAELRVRWPGAATEYTYRDLLPGRLYRIREGDEAPSVLR